MSLEPPRRACEMMLWFILFFAPAAFGATEWWSRAVLESLIFILAAMCALRRDFSAPAGGPLWGFVFILVLGALQLVQARPLTDPAGLLPFTLARPQTLYALLLWAAFAALLWSASGILRWEGALQRLSWAIFLTGLFIAVAGILQRGQGNTAYYGLRPIRQGNPFGPFTNYDHAASWMVASIFVGVGLFAEGFRRARSPLTERLSKQLLIGFALIVQLAAVWETASRGAINALFASALVTSFLAAGAFTKTLPRCLSRVGLILAGFGYCLFLYFNPRWLGFTDGVLDISATARVSMYRSGLRLLGDFPIFGVGLGGFTNAFHTYQDLFVTDIVDHIHSAWFEIAMESGLLGLLIFVAAVFGPLVKLARCLGVSEFSVRAAGMGCFAALFSFTLHGLIDFTFQIPANAILLVVLAAATVKFGPSPPMLVPSAAFPRSVLAGVFMVLSLLSIPPGFAGGAPRLGAPFLSSDDAIFPVLRHQDAGAHLNPGDRN